jgi:hypothetical protein
MTEAEFIEEGHSPLPIKVEDVEDDSRIDMTFPQAMQAIKDGKHIARKSWPEGVYVWMSQNLMIHHDDKSNTPLIVSIGDVEAQDWTIV